MHVQPPVYGAVLMLGVYLNQENYRREPLAGMWANYGQHWLTRRRFNTMTKKTKATGQRVVSNDTNQSFTNFFNKYKFKHLRKKLYSANDDEYSVHHTFNIESDRFSEYNESTRLRKEAVKISNDLVIFSDLIAHSEKQIFLTVSEDDYREILAGNDSVSISPDVSMSISVCKEFKSEHNRLELQRGGLLYEKYRIDVRCHEKMQAARMVFMALSNGCKVFDAKEQELNFHHVEFWLRMHGGID